MLRQRKKAENKIPGDSGHFIRTEIDNTDFKNEDLITKKRRKKLADKTPYSNAGNSNNNNNNIDGTLKILEDITVLEPGKNGQIAAKKIREKY